MHVRSRWRFAFALVALLYSASFLVSAQAAQAADLSITPSTGSVAVGSTLKVQVAINPGSDSVNASDGTLNFDSSVLSVDSISKDGSVFSLWTADPSYSNTDGTVTFSGGTPTAFTSSGTILTIVFKGKAVGSTTITFSKGSILAADGQGTNVYKKGNAGTVTVTAASAPPPTTTPTPAATQTSADSSAVDGATPIAPIIISSTYPKPDTWYGTSTATFTWQLTSDVTAVRTLVSSKDNDTPKVTLKGGATTTQIVTGIPDGTSYFYVQAKNDFGWGDIGKLKVQVDTTPPLTFDIAFQEPGSDGGPPKLAFKTDDQLSGMDHYVLMVGTTTPITIATKDIPDGTYPVPPQGGGSQHVVVRAYDKAGNYIEVAKDLTLPAVAKPKPAASTDTTAAQTTSSGFGFEEYLLIAFALLLGGLFAWSKYTRKTAGREKEKLLQAVLEVRDKNDRIFSAMREEFEQLVQDFDPKPQLTPEERELLEKIKEVLDMSEELVDTGLEDLKKLVRDQP